MKCFDQIRTSLVIPDAHVDPDQSLTRFEKLGQLIVDRKPDRIITMGDFVSLQSLSAWDLNKSGLMEQRRYYLDIEAGKTAIQLMLNPLYELQDRQRKNKDKLYRPRLVFVYGNHEDRLNRYMETRPELKGHLDLTKDLCLNGSGFTDIVPYREYIYFDGVGFTHAPMNAANQPISGRYAIHRAAEIMNSSLVFAHLHRKEAVNFYRHGAANINQVFCAGAFFEHTDEYASGGLNCYHRSCHILNHWAEYRFDVEEFSLERLYQLY